MLYLLVVLGFVFFAGIAMTVNEGLWSNTILLFCILISSLIASVAGVPAGVFILEQMELEDAHAWYAVFAGIWGVFCIVLVLLRLMVDKASQVRVRYLPQVDKFGGILIGLFVSVLFTSFAAFTLWNVPIEAGEWKRSDASDAQLGYFARAVGPFNIVYERFVEVEGIDASLFEK